MMKRISGPVVLAMLAVGAGLGQVGGASAAEMPASEIDYPGASATGPFVAMEPYIISIKDVDTPVDINETARTYDFGGAAPFVNALTGKPDPAGLQAWYHVGDQKELWEIYGDSIDNDGIPGSIEKLTLNGAPVTLIRYNALDGITYEKCRSKLYSYPVPPRTHVRFELLVAFGNDDEVNTWELTPSAHWGDDGTIDNGGSPVLFWALTGSNGVFNQGPIGAHVDTDDSDAAKLMFNFTLKVGDPSVPAIDIGKVRGLPLYQYIPIVIEAFLDERPSGGKGLLKIWVNDALAVEWPGPNLHDAVGIHYWAITTYLWNEPEAYPRTRATFWKMARMFVYPVGSSARPAAPQNLQVVP